MNALKSLISLSFSLSSADLAQEAAIATTPAPAAIAAKEKNSAFFI
nr:hypothetical protein [Ureaplasma diversum]